VGIGWTLDLCLSGCQTDKTLSVTLTVVCASTLIDELHLGAQNSVDVRDCRLVLTEGASRFPLLVPCLETSSLVFFLVLDRYAIPRLLGGSDVEAGSELGAAWAIYLAQMTHVEAAMEAAEYMRDVLHEVGVREVVDEFGARHLRVVASQNPSRALHHVEALRGAYDSRLERLVGLLCHHELLGNRVSHSGVAQGRHKRKTV
jgi:hypothetical protein